MNNQIKKSDQYWLKPKVVAGFALLLLVSIFSVVITYRGFWELSQSERKLAIPGQKFVYISHLTNALYSQEADLRLFTITNDSLYLKSYKSKSSKINESIRALYLLTEGSYSQRQNISQIENLLKRKEVIVKDLIEINKAQKSDYFFDQAFREIADAASQRKQRLAMAKTTTITNRLKDTVITKNNKGNSFFDAVKRFFVGPEKVDTVSSSVSVTTTVDTLDYGAYVSDSIINRLAEALNTIRTDQKQYLNKVSSKEYELMIRERDILSKIQNLTQLLEKQELAESTRQTVAFRETLNRSVIKLIVLGSFTLILLIILIALIFKDISQGNLYRTQLFEAKQYAERLLKSKEQFLANMSHEIRTPLSAIIGLTRQLVKTTLTPKQDALVGPLSRSADHLLSVINDILDYSKLESGQVKFEQDKFSPSEVVNDAIDLFAVKATEKGLQLLANIDSEVPSHLWGDSFRLKQIIMNLLSNSIRFTQTGSVIVSVSVVRQTDEFARILFTVADTGIGIPKEQHQLIFEEFTQAETGVTRKFGGTGLGLTIVKKLVELQGGEIYLTSKPDEGTIIKITLPFNLQGEEKQVEQNLNIIPEGKKILIIDDDDVNRMIVEEMAKSIGLLADSLASPQNLLEKIESEEYCAILTDLHMPEISGYDVVKMVSEASLSVPVIAITANSMITSPEHFTEHGFSGFLIKPFVETDLQKALSPLIGIPQTVQHHTKKAATPPSRYFDLSDLYRFTGGDPKALKLIIRSFLDNTYVNLNELGKAVKTKKIKDASEIAHKMKSGFSQFKIYHIAALLQKIEELKPNKFKALQLYFERLSQEVKPVLKELRKFFDPEKG
ncbi:MAG: response regulator [Bacteroidales bacterium]|nr:response regulator [Bacteroidales bacterium]HRX30604.1 ATP-binding protein [Tenuifilaceae bacterium]